MICREADSPSFRPPDCLHPRGGKSQMLFHRCGYEEHVVAVLAAHRFATHVRMEHADIWLLFHYATPPLLHPAASSPRGENYVFCHAMAVHPTVSLPALSACARLLRPGDMFQP